MKFLRFYLVFILSINCLAGPLEDIANMPDLSLFYQQLIRQQDIQMFLQNIFPQQQASVVNDFTIFAPTNDAMARLSHRNEDLNLLWKYHIISGRFDDQAIYNMAQQKFSEVSPRQMMNVRGQNNLPTTALPFQVFYGLGYYGGTGPQVNDTSENAGYGSGGISWLTQTSLNQTNVNDNSPQLNPYLGQYFNPNQKYVAAQGSVASPNPNLFPQNLTNYYNNVFNPNMNSQYRQTPNINYNPYLHQQQQGYGPMGPNGGVGILRPTINNAFILQSRPMSRGVINVIDDILWPPERRDQTQYKTTYDALEAPGFSRLRQLAERSDYFRSELRSVPYQTWFLPNDQAFASMGSSLSFLLDQSFNNNNTYEINEFIKAHVIPIVLFPVAMDSTKQVVTSSANKWLTFRKVTQPDQSFQVDVISGRHVARILVSRTEEIRLFANGIVYPISTILTTQTRSATDEISRGYPYFLNLVQQSGDMELINLLQGTPNQNGYNPQNMFNVTVLIPQQVSIQQLGNPQELSMHLRRHILRQPVYVDQIMYSSNVYPQQNPYLTGQQHPFIPSQQQPIIPQQQQPLSPQQQQPLVQPGYSQQQPFAQPGYNQQQPFPIPQYQRTASDTTKKLPRRRRQTNVPTNTNFQSQQFAHQQILSGQQQQQHLSRQQIPNQQVLPNQQQQFSQQQMPNQQILPNQQQQFSQQQIPNQQVLSNQQQQFSQQQVVPNQQQQVPNQQQQVAQQQQQTPNQQMLPNQRQQQILPNQQIPPNPQLIPNLQQQIPPNGQQQFNPNTYHTSPYPSPSYFQNGQVYPTMDPQFSVQAQVSNGPNGNIVTLVGRSANALPFTATIVNGESNIPIRNGVMHVIRGLLSGTILSLDGILQSISGASAFNQLLQQTGVINQLRQAGRLYTLFVPTNAALQSIGAQTNVNRLRQFVLRHICADVLLDPTNNVLRRSAGYYNRGQNTEQTQRSRRKRQGWLNNQQNGTNMMMNKQGSPPADLGPGYYQPQQQVYGGYPAAPSPFGSINQLYNPGYVMNGYTAPNSEYFPSYNGSYVGSSNFNYNTLGAPGQPTANSPWNRTIQGPFNPQVHSGINNGGQNYAPGPGNYPSAATYTSGPQSCMALSGDRITIQPLAGTQPEGNTPSMSYQNYIITCCGDPSVNSMLQSFNIYPPNFAVYLIGRSLLPQGQTINTMYNHASTLTPCHGIFLISFISIIFKQIHQF